MKNRTTKINNLRIEDLRAGDIILCPPNDLIGKLIIKLSGGTVSHSAIYSGMIDGKPIIAHAHKYGIVYNTLEELFSTYKESFCYVKRNPTLKTVQPVMDSADKYIEEENPYSFENLIIVCMLGIFSKLSTKVIKSETYYDILERLALSLMKNLSDLLHKDKHPMTCSQFVAQCYTNEDYTIQFEKLIVDTEIRQNLNDTTSLWTIMQQIQITKLLNIEKANTPEIDIIVCDEWNNRIAKDFLQLLEKDKKGELPDGTVSDVDIAKAGAKLLTVLYKLHDISVGSGFSKAIDMNPDDRNFFVTPDDLYSYAIDFVDVGRFDETVF